MIKIDILKDLYNTYNNKRNSLLEVISVKEDRLAELKNIISSLEEKSDDLRFFSPYNSDDIYDNKLDEYLSEKEDITNLLNDNYNLLNELNDYADKLKEVIVSCETFSTTSSIDSDLSTIDSNYVDEHKSFVNDKNDDSNYHLINILKNIKSFIKVDPNRAINEIDILISDL